MRFQYQQHLYDYNSSHNNTSSLTSFPASDIQNLQGREFYPNESARSLQTHGYRFIARSAANYRYRPEVFRHRQEKRGKVELSPEDQADDNFSRKRLLQEIAIKKQINSDQRKKANIRERKRMFNLNEAFDSLRKVLPTFTYEKRLSRIETLRLAIIYIDFLTKFLQGKNPQDISLVKFNPPLENMIQK